LIAGEADSLITAGLAVVVRGTLALANKHLSSSAAVVRMRKFHQIAAAECGAC
jgi:hypothetical protein